MYQIVKFTFPFADDVEKGKPRPSLVVSRSFGKHNQLILAYITTDTQERLDTDILLNSAGDYFSTTGLHSTSLIKLHRLITITPSQISNTIGTLPKKFIPIIKGKLKTVFQLK